MYGQLAETRQRPEIRLSEIELGSIASISSGCCNLLHDWPQENLQPCTVIEKISENRLILQGGKFIRLTEREKKKFLFRNGDLIFNNRTSAGELGKTALFDLNQDVLHTRYLRIRPLNGTDSDLLNRALNLLRSRGQLSAMATHTGNLSFISIEDLRRLRVPRYVFESSK